MALTMNVNAKSVHWILICDTSDPAIGSLNENGRVQLLEHVVKPFSVVLDSLGYENKLYQICGNEYKLDKLLHTLQSINSSPEDFIFMYYMGHGIAMPDSCNSQLPMLMLSHDKSDWIPLDYISEQVKSKDYKAAVLITMSSNNRNDRIRCHSKEYFDSIRTSNGNKEIVSLIHITKEDALKHTFLTDTEFLYFKNLIFNLDGTVMLMSTQRGFSSYGGHTSLGAMDYFTNVLIRELEVNAVEGNIPNIYQTFNDIRTIVSDITDGRQLPFYQMTNAK